MTLGWTRLPSRATVVSYEERTDNPGDVAGKGGTVSISWESAMVLRVADKAYVRTDFP